MYTPGYINKDLRVNGRGICHSSVPKAIEALLEWRAGLPEAFDSISEENFWKKASEVLKACIPNSSGLRVVEDTPFLIKITPSWDLSGNVCCIVENYAFTVSNKQKVYFDAYRLYFRTSLPLINSTTAKEDLRILTFMRKAMELREVFDRTLAHYCCIMGENEENFIVQEI